MSQTVKVGRTSLLARVVEQSPEVVDSAMRRPSGAVVRRSVADVEAEIAAAEDAQRARAARAVASASAPAIEAHTDTTKTAAAVSSAPSAATDHVAPAITARAAVIAASVAPAKARFPARPERSSRLAAAAVSEESVMAASECSDHPPRCRAAAIRLPAMPIARESPAHE
jgi:hypothetical protein